MRKCLFCLDILINIESEFQTPTEITENDSILDIFSKYLHVQFDGDDLPDDDKLPVCLSCQEEINNVEQAAVKVDTLIKEITKICATVCTKVIESEKGRSQEPIDGWTKESHDIDEKFHSIRQSIIQSFDVKINVPDCTRVELPRRKRRIGNSSKCSIMKLEDDNVIESSVNSPMQADDDPDFEYDDHVRSDPDFDVESHETTFKSNMNKLKRKLKRKHTQSKTLRNRETVGRKRDKTNHARIVLDLGDGKFEFLGFEFMKVDDGYQCCSCSYTSRSSIRQNMLFHIKGKHKDVGKFTCTFQDCGKIFGTKKHLRRHGEVHNDNPSHMCELCGRLCKTKKSLNDHKARHEGKLIQECPICQKKVSSKTVLQLHIKTVHEKLKEFECHICSLKVATSQSLKRHLSIHGPKKEKPPRFDVPNKPFACNLCDSRYFHAKANLNYHMQTVHAQEKNFECEICHRKFAKMKLLRRHAYAHTDDRNEICPTCGKLFKNVVYLRNHLKRHEVIEKAFECEICHVKLGTKASLVFHISTVHEKQRKFPCTLCDKKFFTSHALKRHGGTHTTERPFACHMCGGRYQQNCTLKRHIMEVHEKIPPKNPRKTPMQRRLLKAEKMKREEEYMRTLSDLGKDGNGKSVVVVDTALTNQNIPEVHTEAHSWQPLTETTILVDGVNVTQMKSQVWNLGEAKYVGSEFNSDPATTCAVTPVHFSTTQKYLIPSTSFTDFSDPNYFSQEIRDCRNYLRDPT